MLPEPGAIVGGRYRLEELLGSGGMGSVWRARHIELDTSVAVKLMSPELLSSEHSEKRFRREAQAAARLKSPHIVKVFDFGTFDGQPYLAMELLEGEDLAGRLAAQGSLAPAEALRVVDAVAKALEVAHAAGIVHRDLKPANIFVERVGSDEVVKVLDFGIAKLMDSGSDTVRTAELAGTPQYMAPERLLGEAIDVRSDVYSVAVTAYQMLSATLPFPSMPTNPVQQALAQLRGIPTPLLTHRADLPHELVRLISAALSRSAADRPSILELKRGIESCAESWSEPEWPPPSLASRNQKCAPVGHDAPTALTGAAEKKETE